MALCALALVLAIGPARAQPSTTTATTTTSTQDAAENEPPGGGGEELPAAVAEEQITVSSDYRGSAITIFGINPDHRNRGDIVVVLRGPAQKATLMRKRRVLGLWVNGDPVHFTGAPAFFAVLSSKPLREIAPPQVIWALELDPAASAHLESAVPPGGDPSEYRTALVQLRQDQGLYSTSVFNPRARSHAPNERQSLTLYQGGLFRAVVSLPANAPIAEYHADTYLFRNQHLVSSARVPINISRVGIERQIHNLAVDSSFLYGILTVLLALGAGWVAAFVFRRN